MAKIIISTLSVVVGLFVIVCLAAAWMHYRKSVASPVPSFDSENLTEDELAPGDSDTYVPEGRMHEPPRLL